MTYVPPEADIKTVVRVLAEEGGSPGNSVHSWRCEQPARFGDCDCLRYIAIRILEEVGEPCPDNYYMGD